MSAKHPTDGLIGRYVRGGADLPADELWAVEAHLEQCTHCRGRLAVAVADVPEVTDLLTAVRSDLEPALARSVPAPPGRRRIPLRATPAMGPWLAMVVGVSVVAVLLDRVAGWAANTPVVLLVAPALPLAGVAAAWSRSLDPAFELTSVTPQAGLPLLLKRTLTVLAVLLPVHLLAGFLTGVAVAQWLLPSLTLTASAVALGGVVGVGRATAALGTLWTAAVLAPALALGRPFLLQADQLPFWAGALAVAVAVVLIRRHTYTTSATLR
ncbi:zf-HC2 domain-containing protein [Streptomyces griseus]|uniref:zf-HC2 domain-containing protein n=1 Tax=Streptomyces griseus TaxID=1911 RepID=UPI0008404C19|nr:zf-HC2 domain-containing protein [Streptomyces griseus]